jgi:hypothetical protein
MTVAGCNMEGPWHAINEDVRSSNCLRIEDFQPCDLRGPHRFDRLRHGGFAGVGTR